MATIDSADNGPSGFGPVGFDGGGPSLIGRAAARTMLSNVPHGVLGALFLAYAKAMHRVSSSVSRQQEVAADRFAVKAYGSRSLTSALSKLDDADVALDQYAQLYLAPLFDHRAYPAALFQGFTQVHADPARREQRQDAVATRSRRQPSPYDTHPTPSVRLEMLAQWPEVAGTSAVDERPAVGLLAPTNDAEGQLAAMWAGRVVGEAEPVDWQQAGEIYGTNLRAHAALGFDEETDVGTWLSEVSIRSSEGDWDEPRRRLTRAVPNASSSHERLQAWLEAVVKVAIAELGSGQWRISFAGPVEVIDARGVAVSSEMLAGALLDGRPDRVLAVISSLTASPPDAEVALIPSGAPGTGDDRAGLR